MPDNVNTAQAVATTPEIKVTGNPDVWVLICKASAGAWMKSTKAMQVPGGVVLQVTSEHRGTGGIVTACAEALTFIPGAAVVVKNGAPQIVPA